MEFDSKGRKGVRCMFTTDDETSATTSAFVITEVQDKAKRQVAFTLIKKSEAKFSILEKA